MSLKVKLNGEWVTIPTPSELNDEIISKTKTYSSQHIEDIFAKKLTISNTEPQDAKLWYDTTQVPSKEGTFPAIRLPQFPSVSTSYSQYCFYNTANNKFYLVTQNSSYGAGGADCNRLDYNNDLKTLSHYATNNSYAWGLYVLESDTWSVIHEGKGTLTTDLGYFDDTKHKIILLYAKEATTGMYEGWSRLWFRKSVSGSITEQYVFTNDETKKDEDEYRYTPVQYLTSGEYIGTLGSSIEYAGLKAKVNDEWIKVSKQLIAGTGISIVDNVISVTGGGEGAGEVIEIGSYQYSHKGKILPAIQVDKLREIYTKDKTATPLILHWTLYGTENNLKVVSSDYIASNYSIDVLVHNQYHCEYKWDDSTEGIVNPTVNEAEVDLTDYVKNTDYATKTDSGVVKVDSAFGVQILTGANEGKLSIVGATPNEIKYGATSSKVITPYSQHNTVFYGLAKASGDTTQSTSANPVGTYTDEAKASIQKMLGVEKHTYSTDEQVVGTWIDGKLLYEKTFELNSVSTGYLNVDIPTNIDTDFISSAYLFLNDGEVLSNNFKSRFQVSIWENKKPYLNTDLTSEINKLVFTIQYTKTTD